MAQKTPTKLVKTKIYRCCCKPLGNNRPISLFGEKSKREAIIEGYKEITDLKGNENDGLSQFVCWSCDRNIATFNEFKTLCRESYNKQMAYHLESGNTRVQRGERILKKPHQVPRFGKTRPFSKTTCKDSPGLPVSVRELFHRCSYTKTRS